MQNVIEFPRAASLGSQQVAAAGTAAGAGGPDVAHAAGAIGNMIEALSRTIDQIGMLREMLPDGSIRDQLKAEQNRLLAGLFTARQTSARLQVAMLTLNGQVLPAALRR